MNIGDVTHRGRHPNVEVWRVLALLNELDVPLHADLLNEASSDPP